MWLNKISCKHVYLQSTLNEKIHPNRSPGICVHYVSVLLFVNRHCCKPCEHSFHIAHLTEAHTNCWRVDEGQLLHPICIHFFTKPKLWTSIAQPTHISKWEFTFPVRKMLQFVCTVNLQLDNRFWNEATITCWDSQTVIMWFVRYDGSHLINWMSESADLYKLQCNSYSIFSWC